MKGSILIICLAIVCTADSQDMISGLQRKNIIKLDLTSHILYRNAFGISYERLLTSKRSFSLSFGYQEFPVISTLGQNIVVRDDRKRHGYKVGGEYRFYLAKENKYMAPRGLYIGPYFIFHRFNNNRLIEVNNNGMPEQAILESRLGIFNLGFQMGYQFLVKKRWTIDLVFAGPSISNYRYTAEIAGSYSFDKEYIKNQAILDLIDRFPFLDDLISGKEVEEKGKLDAWSLGYRYQLQIGYHFGKKK